MYLPVRFAGAVCAGSPVVNGLDAIIVGAGAAGLTAARELKRANKQVIILEAGDLLGGRVRTIQNSNAGLPIELGAEFIHGEAPETTKLLDEARLVTVPVLGKHYRSDDGELSPQGPIWKRMSRVFKRINPDRKVDRSFQEFLDEKPGGRRLADERKLALGFVEGFNGADASRISEKSLAQQGDPTEGAADARRIINGYSALIDYIARDVVRDVRLNSRVNRIDWNDDGVRVTTDSDQGFNASAVIVTVPLAILQDETIAIEPEIPSLRKAANQLVMGQVVRVNVVVKERFWEKKIDDLSYLHAPTRPFTVWWPPSPLKAPLLTGWSGGPSAVAMIDEGNVEDRAIAELARAFGTRRDRIEKLIDSFHSHDWTSDRFFRGAYSYAGVGGAFAARTLARPASSTVFIAGEATDSGSGGTVEGAIASGKRAALKVLEQLRS